MDINVLPVWKKGYTGKGIVVSILDDGGYRLMTGRIHRKNSFILVTLQRLLDPPSILSCLLLCKKLKKREKLVLIKSPTGLYSVYPFSC